MREIVVDNFAGGGGASTGIALALGRSPDIAINHDPAAIAMHKINHPDTKHYCESVWEVDPVEAAAGRPVGLAWFSPDCKHFSKAKGGKPVEKGIRGLAWVAVRWAKQVHPRIIMLENVEEFKTWGPLMADNKPNPQFKGRTFHHFIHALERYGYRVEFKELRACDYGAPTIRKRFFMIARCDGQPIVWPEPTHGDPKTLPVVKGRLKPWHTAAEIIDWSIPCKSIFDRERPLAENTMRRIARGLQRFVIDNPDPFIVRQFGASVGHEIDKPLGTITAGGGGKCALVTPYITKFRSGSTGHMMDVPLATVTSGCGSKRPAGAPHALGLVAPTLIQYHGEQSGADVRGQSLEKPLMVVDASPRYGLVSSFLTKFYGTNVGSSLFEPMPTITATGQHIGEVRAFLTKYYNHGDGQSLWEPLHTVTTKDRIGLVTVAGEDYQISDIGMRMLEPRELFNAQGFPPDYVIDFDCNGKHYSKSAQVARCGNAVPPQLSEALVKANYSDMGMRSVIGNA